MDAPRTVPERPRTEDLQVFVILGGSIFAISALIIGVILALSPR